MKSWLKLRSIVHLNAKQIIIKKGRKTERFIGKYNLVESWLEYHFAPEVTSREAVNKINIDLNANYSLSDFGKWRRGNRHLPNNVRSYMALNGVKQALLKSFGLSLTDNEVSNFIKRIENPDLNLYK